MSSDTSDSIRSSTWTDCIFEGLGAVHVTSIPVILGLLFGAQYLRGPSAPAGSVRPDPLKACFQFDATHYLQIVKNGYDYNPEKRSVVAFFPAYPLLSRWGGALVDASPELAALVTANITLAGAFILFAAYLRTRWPGASRDLRILTLALFGLWPAGLFLRMPYAESLFVLGTLGALYGMARRWPLLVLAVLAGGVTATRPVGVAVAAAVLWHAWGRLPPSPVRRAVTIAGLFPVAIWGLLAYVSYQTIEFGAPLGFAQTQEHWTSAAPANKTWTAKLESLATLEPIWGVYDPTSSRYWGRRGDRDAIFGILFWNPILFVAALVLTVVGRFRGWLSGPEFILGIGLLVIPYLTRSYEMSMASHARFGMVVLIQYPVLARLLANHPYPAGVVLVTCAVMLFVWTSLYATGHPIF